jgi:hypothetical protein
MCWFKVLRFFSDVVGLKEYIELGGIISAFPDEAQYVTLARGLLIVVVVLARSDIVVTPETVNNWVSANWEPLRDMPTMNGDLGQHFFERINNDAYLGVAGSAAIVRLAGMMGPRGFSEKRLLQIRLEPLAPLMKLLVVLVANCLVQLKFCVDLGNLPVEVFDP